MWRELRRIQREQAALAELPTAQLTALTANINRDSKKQSKPFTANDFALFQGEREDDKPFRPDVAAVALALRHEGKAPPMLLTCWQQVLASATEHCKPPSPRAWHSDDDAVWVLAPAFEGSNVRGGLVLVRGPISGSVLLRDLDRPLLTHRVELPKRKGFGWIEAGLLLLGPEN